MVCWSNTCNWIFHNAGVLRTRFTVVGARIKGKIEIRYYNLVLIAKTFRKAESISLLFAIDFSL